MKRFLLTMIGPAIVVAVTVIIFLAGCARQAVIMPMVNVQCPQPAAAALSPAEQLPLVPRLSPNPEVAVKQFSELGAGDAKVYGDEVDKRETLIDHGVRLCGWTR